ncbi:transcription-repair coupling factor [Escherichia coli]|uniref:Transcription-repair coupling factor n=1 Tax=Escherichia coli TaxID=562 RepID=A0A376TI85_ECOLX|nr:transcription-repair coupling factor [Escherichia coli]
MNCLAKNKAAQWKPSVSRCIWSCWENAVDALKAGRGGPSLEDLTSQQTEVELRMPSLLPDDFIPDVNTRLSFYKRIASAKTENELEEIKVELIDRFGLLPDPARTLLDVARLRQQAQKTGDQEAGR